MRMPSGGNLSASVAILTRERGGAPLALQLLYYPAVDVYDPGSPDFPSYKEFSTRDAEGALLTTDDAMKMMNMYFTDQSEARDTRFAVLRADLAGLPPAVILTAEVDPLRDEGKAYADKLKAAGVPTEYKLMEGTMHGFMSFPVPQNAEGMMISVAALRAAFGLADCPS